MVVLTITGIIAADGKQNKKVRYHSYAGKLEVKRWQSNLIQSVYRKTIRIPEIIQ
jgi:hypothetical protein